MYFTPRKRTVAGKLFLVLALALPFAAIPGIVEAGATLDKIRKSRQLRCGVSEGKIEGFSFRDGNGRWQGIDADFCRAVAAAVLGDAEQVKFVPLATSARFPALKLDTIDLLARNTTYTFSREAEMGLHFAGILYFDYQAVIVPSRSKVRRISDLDGATICVIQGTTSETNLTDFFTTRKIRYVPLTLPSEEEAGKAFLEGRCQAASSDASKLSILRARTPKGNDKFRILPDIIAKEPLGPVIKKGDEEWLTVVKWVLFALIEAEEQGVSRYNARFQHDENADRFVQDLLGVSNSAGRALGLSDDWAVQVIEAAGNYGEMFERNVGRQSRLKLDRGLNSHWTKGGLMYSPPLH